MRIGHRQVRSLQTPANQGMSRRADKRVDATANSAAAKLEHSLATDGSIAFIWNSKRGHEPCTCRSSDAFDNDSFSNEGSSGFSTTEVSTSVDDEGNVTSSASENNPSSSKFGDDDYTYVGERLTEDNLDSYLRDRMTEETVPDKINQDHNDVEDFFGETDGRPLDGDIISAFELDGQPGVGANRDDDNNPLVDELSGGGTLEDVDDLLTPSTVSCPICLGRGNVDTLDFYNGQRIILHAGSPNLSVQDSEFLEDQPLRILQPAKGNQIIWSNVKIPSLWKHLVRIVLFDMGRVVPLSDAKVYYIHSSAPGTKIPLNFDSINALQKSGNLSVSNSIDIVVEAAQDDIEFTHFEMLFSLGRVVKIQVPEIEVPRQEEFIDWNLNVQFEMSASITIRENSYIVEGKYNRLWKVSSLIRKTTAAGKAHVYQVNARAVHRYERAALILRVLGSHIDPFSDSLDDDIDEEL